MMDRDHERPKAMELPKKSTRGYNADFQSDDDEKALIIRLQRSSD